MGFVAVSLCDKRADLQRQHLVPGTWYQVGALALFEDAVSVRRTRRSIDWLCRKPRAALPFRVITHLVVVEKLRGCAEKPL